MEGGNVEERYKEQETNGSWSTRGTKQIFKKKKERKENMEIKENDRKRAECKKIQT